MHRRATPVWMGVQNETHSNGMSCARRRADRHQTRLPGAEASQGRLAGGEGDPLAPSPVDVAAGTLYLITRVLPGTFVKSSAPLQSCVLVGACQYHAKGQRFLLAQPKDRVSKRAAPDAAAQSDPERPAAKRQKAAAGRPQRPAPESPAPGTRSSRPHLKFPVLRLCA